MSARTTTLAWSAKVSDEDKAGLLALAEISSDAGGQCSIMGNSIEMLINMLGWTDDRADAWLLRALDLEPLNDGAGGSMFPIGLYGGLFFRFEEVVARLEQKA